MQLSQKIDALQSEKALHAKKLVQLQSKLAQLKESDATRAKTLDEDREAINKVKLELDKKRMKSAAQTEECLTKLKEFHQRCLSKGGDEEEKGGSGEKSDRSEMDELAARAVELRHKAQVAEEASHVAELEKVKLEQNLADTLDEFANLDSFARTVQAQYDAIQLWYELFHSWNIGAACNTCNTPIQDIGAMVDAHIAKNKSLLTSSATTAEGSFSEST